MLLLLPIFHTKHEKIWMEVLRVFILVRLIEPLQLPKHLFPCPLYSSLPVSFFRTTTMVSLSPLSPLPISLLSIVLFSLFIFTDLPTTQSTTTSGTEYLKLRLLHKNPFPNPSQALSSDTHRLSTLFSALHTHQNFKSPVISGASTGSGQYFVNLQLGTPPQNLLLVADTGSDLVWVKCSACKNCSSHAPGSAFLARHSTTFSPHHCYNPSCRLVPHPKHTKCNNTRLHSPCRYDYSYADGSRTSGFFSKEATKLNTSSGKESELDSLAFGCGFQVSGPSVSGASFNGAHGVMGLGRGPISFPSQMGRQFGNKFSYCLMDYTLSPPPTSFLFIGGTQDVSMMNYTPLQINPLSPTFYYIGIKTVSVDGFKLPIEPSVWSVDEWGNGGTVIDSGTTLTFLAEKAYRQILTAFKRRVKLPSPAELTPGFDLCVNVSELDMPSLPRLSFELVGDSLFSPPWRNYFFETEDQVMCLAIQPVNSASGFSVLGNLMQQGFLLEFDKDRSRVGFSRRGCALP